MYLVNTRCGTHHTSTHITQSIKLGHHTRENNSLARLFSFQSYAPHVALSRLSFSRNPLILHLSLSLHQLNTKPNIVKSHKVHGYKLKQLQHFLSWNKANIKHSCKSRLYTSFLSTTHFGIKVNQNQVNKLEVLKAVFRKFHVLNHFIKQNIEVNHINTEN